MATHFTELQNTRLDKFDLLLKKLRKAEPNFGAAITVIITLIKLIPAFGAAVPNVIRFFMLASTAVSITGSVFKNILTYM